MDMRATSRSRTRSPQLVVTPNPNQPQAVPAPHEAVTNPAGAPNGNNSTPQALAVQLVKDHGLSTLTARRQGDMPQPSDPQGAASPDPMDTKQELDLITARLNEAFVLPAREFLPQSKDHVTLPDYGLEQRKLPSKTGNPEDAGDYSFLPSDELYKILQPHSVKRCLQALGVCQTDTMVQKLVDYICGPPVTSSGTGPTARMLFAILLYNFEPSSILSFYQESLYDHDLPFSTTKRPGAGKKYDVFKKDGTPVVSFNSWSIYEARDFVRACQWQLFVPYFAEDISKPGLTPPLPVYHLFEPAILPFTELGKRVAVGNSEVYQIQIHPSQHRFDYVAPSRSPRNMIHIHPGQHAYPSVSLPCTPGPRTPFFPVSESRRPRVYV